MWRRTRNFLPACLAALLVAVALWSIDRRAAPRRTPAVIDPGDREPPAPWPQFGGPRRDFTVDQVGPTSSLSTVWPDDGPPVTWRRTLGEGYSGIIVDRERLFTLYRSRPDEVVIALRPDTGETLWTHRYPAEIDTSRHPSGYGHGPRSTPLLAGGRLFTIGFNGLMHCLDPATGRVLWSIHLIEHYDGSVRRWGYACSPLAWEQAVIVFTGGRGASIVALDQATGDERWRRHDFDNSYASPMLINLAGRTQLVCFMAREVVGLDPATGDLLWNWPHENQWHNNIVNPVWGDDGLLFIASEGHGGGRVLELRQDGDETIVRELWASPKLRISHRNAIRIGDYIYATTGDFGPALFTAFHVRSGKIAWRRRGFADSSLLRLNDRQDPDAGIPVNDNPRSDGKLLVLDEDGDLSLVTVTPEGLTSHARFAILERQAWTPPTLVGNQLYLRDRKTVVAVELP